MEHRSKLVLSRREGDKIRIYPKEGEPIEISIGRLDRRQVKVAVVAEPHVRILRAELDGRDPGPG